MLEPLTGITIPDENAALRESWGSTNAERRIIMLNEVYNNALSEENVAVTATRFIEAGFRLITVEGDEKQLKKEEHKHLAKLKIKDLLASGTRVSAGVLHLLATSALEFEVWGVDSLAVNQAQLKVMTELLEVAQSREALFGRFRELLDKTMRKLYTSEMRKLTEIRFPLFQAKPKLSEQIPLLQQLGREAGLEIDAYPAISSYIEVLRLEKRLNEPVINRQREELVKMLVEKAFGWWKLTPPNLLSFDLQKAEPILAFWVKKTGRTEEQLEDEVASRGEEAVFLDCKQWLEKWLVGSALNARLGGMASHVLYEDWILFALRFDIDVFKFRELREYIYMLRKTATIKPDELDEEIKSCAEQILDLLGRTTEQKRLAETVGKIDFLYRAYRLELPPDQLEQFDMTSLSLLELQRELGNISGKPTLDLGVTNQLESARDKAFDFYKFSRERGLIMLKNTLELMSTEDQDRAMLVYGGFHNQTITAHLKTMYPDIAWSVIHPTPDLSGV